MKSLTHFCPFCSNRLQIYLEDYHTIYACVDKECINDDMPRYKVYYNNYPTRLLSVEFMLDKYYIQISHVNETTTISVLLGAMLFDSIEIPRVVFVDFDHLNILLSKIKILFTFS